MINVTEDRWIAWIDARANGRAARAARVAKVNELVAVLMSTPAPREIGRRRIVTMRAS